MKKILIIMTIAMLCFSCNRENVAYEVEYEDGSKEELHFSDVPSEFRLYLDEGCVIRHGSYSYRCGVKKISVLYRETIEKE